MTANTPFRLFGPTVALLALLIGLGLSSCERKYEDGPSISLKSRESRAANNWTATLLSRNNIDELRLYETFNLNINEGGTFSWATRLEGDTIDSTVEGIWELATLDTQIKLEYVDSTINNETRLLYMDIFRLKEKELWVTYQIDADYFTVYMEPQ